MSQLYDNTPWDWDSESRSTANGLLHTFTSFEHIAAFILTKEILEPLRPISESLQGRLPEVFQKVNEVMQFYRQLRRNVEREHSRMYTGVKKLADDVGIVKKNCLTLYTWSTK